MRKVGIGFMSGSIASVANIPIDVAKSRIQVQFVFHFVYSLSPVDMNWSYCSSICLELTLSIK